MALTKQKEASTVGQVLEPARVYGVNTLGLATAVRVEGATSSAVKVPASATLSINGFSNLYRVCAMPPKMVSPLG